ncbi:hypothetical protein BCR36DRAFT_349386 [Piromyces finnis]|uniref:DUF4042 domain-containing protein n=1 Tax=Piromyces finnis TaxID=1754191 RepID=A0A1Y1VEM3_9FUNG|nr:hypothetical protein BCR36DRAFT_349386 [Piromyces finnis]|eukprot:ORX53426.1 hypothetical protein BCR36DRAFT_349386 [Piromyces finnis]
MKYEINWEKYWLNENGYLLWLITGMKSENIKVKSLSYGILANIIPFKGSYKYICLQAPQFIDSTFDLLINKSTDILLKKELLSVLNNFLVSFNDKIYKNYSYDTNGVENDSGNENIPEGFIDEEQMKQLEVLFIKSGFFSNLKYLINNHCDCLAYKISLIELILNIAQRFKDILINIIIEQELWEDLFKFLIIPTYNSSKPENELLEYTMSYNLRYYYQNNSDYVYNIIYSTLKLFLIIFYDNEELEYKIIENTSFINKLQNIIIFMNAYLSGYSNNPNNCGNMKNDSRIRKFDKFQCQVVRLLCLLIGDSLQQCIKNDLKSLFIRKSFLLTNVKISSINVLCEMIIYQNGIENKKAATYLLARLLNYYFQLNTNIDNELIEILNNNISHHYGCTVGYFLCRELYLLLMNDHLNSNSVFNESLYVSLKILLMYCQSAKQYFIEENVCQKLYNKISKLRENYKFSEVNQKKIILYISLLRYSLLDSLKVKEILYHLNINSLLIEFLQSKRIYYNIVYEVLLFERNFITNYPLAKKSLFENQRNLSNEYGNSIVSHISKLLNKDDLKIEVFGLIIELFNSIAISFDSRIYLIKVNFIFFRYI